MAITTSNSTKVKPLGLKKAPLDFMEQLISQGMTNLIRSIIAK
jgi:hypothetical protein